LLDFSLRGGQDAPAAAARVAYRTERYLNRAAARDVMAVVTEMVAWMASGEPVPRTIRLEFAVTPSEVRVSVTATRRLQPEPKTMSNRLLREMLPVTAALATRYGLEANRRTRVWAEFDRYDTDVPAYIESQYSR
jgi:hypothetical protein